jgi:MarR family transcriptional regulator, negative regulator of the multidrug operon emrRAB
MEDRAAELIERLGMVRRAARRAAATAAGLSVAQLDALSYLGACNRFSDTPAAVAAYLDTTRGTASQSLLALERKGLLTRVDDLRDGRMRHLRLTPAGRSVLAETAIADEIAGSVEALGPERAALERLLDRVLRTAQRGRGGRTFGRCGECRHLLGAPGAWRCGLTAEVLSPRDTTLLCIEHERAPAA